jgi:hypothetical protein
MRRQLSIRFARSRRLLSAAALALLSGCSGGAVGPDGLDPRIGSVDGNDTVLYEPGTTVEIARPVEETFVLVESIVTNDVVGLNGTGDVSSYADERFSAQYRLKDPDAETRATLLFKVVPVSAAAITNGTAEKYPVRVSFQTDERELLRFHMGPAGARALTVDNTGTETELFAVSNYMKWTTGSSADVAAANAESKSSSGFSLTQSERASLELGLRAFYALTPFELEMHHPDHRRAPPFLFNLRKVTRNGGVGQVDSEQTFLVRNWISESANPSEVNTNFNFADAMLRSAMSLRLSKGSEVKLLWKYECAPVDPDPAVNLAFGTIRSCG